MAAIQDVMQTISPRLAILPDYDGQEPPHTYYTKLRAINETARPLGVAAFNDAERANVMKSKMTGRFFPVPAQNPYNANANIVTEAEVYNWMQGKYRETMIGNQRASLKALMSERFTSLDTIDTYEKRIRSYVLGIDDGEVLPYLYDHLPPRLGTRIRITNPNTVNDFFTQLRIIWLESGGSTSNFGNEINTSASAMAYSIPINQFPQKNIALEKFVDIAIRLGYSGDLSDPIAIHQFVENDLTRNYGRQSNHIKKEPFGQNNNTKKVYATKKPQKPTKVTYKCSNCGKIGHRKNKCPKLESGGSTSNFGNEINTSASAMAYSIPINQFPQKNIALEKFVDIAIRLGYSGDLSDPIAIHQFVENDLTRNYGRQSNHIKKEPFGQNNNTKKVYATKKPQKPTKVTYKCSNCEKIGHRKNKCPKLGKKPKKVNYTYQSEPENSDQEDEPIEVLEDKDEENDEEDEESIPDTEPQNCFNGEVFLESLKYMISELVPHCPKEILIEARIFLNNLFIKMKDQFDSYYSEKYTVKERNKVWEIIAKKYLTIFQSLIEIIKDQSPNPSSHKETNHDYELISQPEKLDNSITCVENTELRSLNHAIKIDFLDIKEPNDVATISCRIGDLIIPHAILDTGADDSLFTGNIPEYLGIKINKKNVHKLTGAVGDSQSIGTSYNVPITIDSGEDSITVYEKEISVIPTKKDRNGNDISIMILDTKWQHHIGWDPIVKGEFIVTHNGKTITIPLSTHKEKYSHKPLGNSLNHVTASVNIFNTEKKTNVLCSDTDTIKKITGTDI
ncbi:hypothetical protein Glove_136g17 [Diversispora epigaea]|uniref:CCHC-type domain-containing protein n=1 Tax=Diversispora epigaea TaxID=1348612 RepID=A0A397J186_9GLOM|nr:hypothetical protein Glove_136g17 [Diversispora epigaea]